MWRWRQVELQMEVVLADFNSNNIAVTMWALATFGRIPGAPVMALLQRRVEAISGECETSVCLLYKYKCTNTDELRRYQESLTR